MCVRGIGFAFDSTILYYNLELFWRCGISCFSHFIFCLLQ